MDPFCVLFVLGMVALGVFVIALAFMVVIAYVTSQPDLGTDTRQQMRAIRGTSQRALDEAADEYLQQVMKETVR